MLRQFELDLRINEMINKEIDDAIAARAKASGIMMSPTMKVSRICTCVIGVFVRMFLCAVMCRWRRICLQLLLRGR